MKNKAGNNKSIVNLSRNSMPEQRIIGMLRAFFLYLTIHLSLLRIREGKTVNIHMKLIITPFTSANPISAPSLKLIKDKQLNPATVVSELPAIAGKAVNNAVFMADKLSVHIFWPEYIGLSI